MRPAKSSVGIRNHLFLSIKKNEINAVEHGATWNRVTHFIIFSYPEELRSGDERIEVLKRRFLLWNNMYLPQRKRNTSVLKPSFWRKRMKKRKKVFEALLELRHCLSHQTEEQS